MKAPVWFYAVMILVLLVLGTVVIAHSETKVLPKGTVITTPDGKTDVLTADYFLDDRATAEAEANALEGRQVDAKTILRLQTLSDGQQKRIDGDNRWKTAIGIGAFILGVVADEIVKR
jgi:hypothetical protein